MRFFYVAVAETREDMLQAIIDTIAEWDARARPRGIRVGVLIRYTKWRSRPCLPCGLARDRGLPVFVDNGAFSFLTVEDLEGAPSPLTLSRWRVDYAEWLRRNWETLDYAALPDIPVHGRRFLGPGERRERVRLSTANQSAFLDLVRPPAIRERLVPVVQGYTVEEYEYSLELLRKYGVLEETAYGAFIPNHYTGILAVGSVCVRKWSANGKTGLLAEGKAAGTLREWLPQFLDRCCPEASGFHLFGLHREATAAFGLHPRFYAADSGAHGLNYKYKWKSVLGCTAPNTPSCAAKAVDRQLSRTLQPLLSRSIEEYMRAGVAARG